ncbi:putative proteinP-dependent succinate-semialdehyde dehydrogenase protein [Pseudomonas syringae pv. philadelphi]|uniref:Aldehyde dehydrogenase domain-containing protein n=1 Tax=Pseudomonas syringae pv. philadelphi TaxID=251706 RepID=A0A3M3YMK1_9PSED|nr:NAD-dependent succinate-semialdehyde dehydrogenase [Pseudomonas syringae group genomosp. 3]RMO82914.1 putative proteinP-dependent succinate-semialdehyde dehydrogenase protein [Pseudomonas syringae pv. philadelphi]
MNASIASSALTLLRDLAWIDGQWVAAEGGRRFAVTDPHDGRVLAEVPNMGAAETHRAIAAAAAALPEWRARTAKQRSAILRRWFDLVVAHTDELAAVMTAEQGKPLAEARGEIAYAASFIEWFAEEAKRISGDVLEHPQPGNRILVLKQAVGVCAAITPWNFPVAMITRKVAPALAAGCTIVVKPAEQTPLSALALCVLAEAAGIPNGVLNVVTGSASAAPDIGGAMTSSPLVRKLTFTGSTEIGRLLISQCAGTVKKLSMELGGNAPMIVFDDADLDVAAAGAMAAKYRNTGQACIAANRIYVQDGVYEVFAEKLTALTRALITGQGTQAGVTQGPLIDEEAVQKVEAHVLDALEQGARVLVGGRRHSLGGSYYQPTVLADVTPAMRLAREETFGPVAPLLRFHAEADVIAMANDTEFGLAAYLFSQDSARIWRVTEALEAGMIGVNTGLISNEVAPFGGVKQSGLGREGSRYGIEEFLEMKYVSVGEIK